jgi:uncharacterized membrane protein YphA (DoxX/SURF4 family)
MAVIARLFLGGVFAYAGFMKLMEPEANFRAVLEQTAWLPEVWIPVLSKAIPWMEWLGGMFVLMGLLTRVGTFLLAILSAAFMVSLALSLAQGEGLRDCGCFGTSGPHLSVTQAFLLDALTTALGLILFLKHRHRWAVDNLFEREGKAPGNAGA